MMSLDWILYRTKNIIRNRHSLVDVTLLFVLTLCNIVFTSEIGNQTTYGKAYLCLLSISNYYSDGKVFLFTSASKSCSIAFSFGIINSIASSLLLAFTVYTHFRKVKISPRVNLLILVLSCLMTMLMFIAVMLTTIGISVTCSYLGQNKCGSILSEGFFEKDNNQLYPKNLNLIYLANTLGWIAFVLWLSYSGVKFFDWKYSSVSYK